MRFKTANIRGGASLFMGKPTKCPNGGNDYFHWSEERRGKAIWKCNNCGYEISD